MPNKNGIQTISNENQVSVGDHNASPLHSESKSIRAGTVPKNPDIVPCRPGSWTTQDKRVSRYLSGETARNWTSGHPNAPCRRACSLRGAIQRAPCS